MNLSLCFDSGQRVHSGGSLHRKAAVEGEWSDSHLNVRELWILTALLNSEHFHNSQEGLFF